MSRIRSRNTALETFVFKFLQRERIYFLKHYSKIAGAPDIALPRKKKAVFIDGDFWHGWRFARRKSRLPEVYWQAKIEANIARDRSRRSKLKRQGWKVLRVWEHQLKASPELALNKIKVFLTK
jgi:DNA mismatch endonuclease (patch repair protein)